MLTGPPRATTISLSAGMRSSIAAENGASWVIAISGQADKADDRLGLALVFLEAVHPRLGVAVPHRLVGPRQFHRLDIERPVQRARIAASNVEGVMNRSPMMAIFVRLRRPPLILLLPGSVKSV